MDHFRMRPLIIACLVGVTLLASPTWAADELTAAQVLRSIDLGKQFLVRNQNDDGSWTLSISGVYAARFQTGVTSLALLSLLNSGMKLEDPPVARGLAYLRSVREPEPDYVYEVALMIMALEAARDGQRDLLLMRRLANKLEAAQRDKGPHRGSWGYTVSDREFADWPGDRSNAQYAILGLHAAAEAGVAVKRTTWERARKHWQDTQNGDGGWSYSSQQNFQGSTGSMTAAGIASLIITESHLRDPAQDETPDGQPLCCQMQAKDERMENAVQWMAKHFAVAENPGNPSGRILYYLYGIERAGRLSAQRFFGPHDWYRRGAEFLLKAQNRGQLLGGWVGQGHVEKDPVVGTSFALLFLSKGLSPVLIQKLMYGKPDGEHAVQGNNWNQHPGDIRRLTEHVSGLPKWPPLVTWQILDLNKVVKSNDTGELRQAPILFLSGQAAYRFTQTEAALLRAYVDQGGFILGAANCPENDGGFEQSFRELIKLMYPQGEASLLPLTDEHLVFRSEYPLNGADFDLHGVDVGCRTAIMFSRDDLGCLWEKIEAPTPEGRSPALAKRIERDTKMGVNVVAYATGREPPNKLDADQGQPLAGEQDRIERGFLQIAKLRHSGGWDVAPRALKNLLMGLNQQVGQMATTKDKVITASDPDLYKYPLVYVHGRTAFQLSDNDLAGLREHLNRGGVLFGDACCSARPFDLSFREMAQKLYPEARLTRIPPTHELFTNQVFHDLSRVKRRVAEIINPGEPLTITEREVEPYLEGIEIDGRYVVIYSKYDISCALERQTSAACAGYVPEDALKIAVNVVMYALLQNASYQEGAKEQRGKGAK